MGLIERSEAVEALEARKDKTAKGEVGGFYNTIIQHDIDAIEQLPPAKPKWIPCSERMPEEEYVLISKKPTKISGNKWSVTIAIRTADPRSGEVSWRDIGFGKIPDDYVLAWMPLPNCYQGDGK